jgi:hypothetical protein
MPLSTSSVAVAAEHIRLASRASDRAAHECILNLYSGV